VTRLLHEFAVFIDVDGVVADASTPLRQIQLVDSFCILVFVVVHFPLVFILAEELFSPGHIGLNEGCIVFVHVVDFLLDFVNVEGVFYHFPDLVDHAFNRVEHQSLGVIAELEAGHAEHHADK